MFRLICVPLLLLLIYQVAVRAADAASIMVREEEGSSNCDDGCSTRTLFEIIWGCVSTTIICAWSTLHPNIPPREGPLKATLRRVMLMFLAILAPEMIPAWALNQLLAAMDVRDVYNKGKGHEKERRGIWKTIKDWVVSLYKIKEPAGEAWTLKHGHFLVMGGFHLVEPPEEKSTSETEETTDTESDKRVVNTDVEQGHKNSEKALELTMPAKETVTILTLEMLKELVKDPEFKIEISEDEITGRSKGDALSKLIFALQTSWFIVQCIARKIQGLDMTQLELTTLALASLNAITFALWWDKPLGAQIVVRKHLKRKLTKKEMGPDRIPGIGVPLTVLLFEVLQNRLRNIVRFKDWIRLPLTIFQLFLLPITSIGFVFWRPISSIQGSSFTFPTEATHVPTFYVPRHRHFSKSLHALFLMTLATIFGGIHCAGWNYLFPTFTQHVLWRVASLAVTIIPVATVPFVAALIEPIQNDTFTFPFVIVTLASIIVPIMTVAYVSARLVLLGLALDLLRHQPPGSFIIVNWTKFYPHLF